VSALSADLKKHATGSGKVSVLLTSSADAGNQGTVISEPTSQLIATDGYKSFNKASP
jgi:hypothetical protein